MTDAAGGLTEPLVLREESISWTPTDDGSIVVLDLRSSEYLSVNSSATVLWEALVAGGSQESLVKSLVTTFGIDEATARPDVAEFIEQLRARDLLLPAAL